MTTTTLYFMNINEAMKLVDENKRDVRYFRRALGDRYRISPKRIQIEDGYVSIYEPNASSMIKRIEKDGWKVKNHLGIVSKEEV